MKDIKIKGRYKQTEHGGVVTVEDIVKGFSGQTVVYSMEGLSYHLRMARSEFMKSFREVSNA